MSKHWTRLLACLLLSPSLYSAIVINHIASEMEYVLQANCHRVVENGFIPAKKTLNEPATEIGKRPHAIDNISQWCLTLTDTSNQAASVIKLDNISNHCHIHLYPPTATINITLSDNC